MKTLTQIFTIIVLAGLSYGSSFADKVPVNNSPVYNSNHQKSVFPGREVVTDNPPSDYSYFPQNSGTGNTLISVSTVSDMIGWAAGSNSTVRRTTDGGNTWTNASGTGITGHVYDIYAVNANTAFCTTTPDTTFIYKTTNGGTTWTKVFAQAGGFIDAIQMVSPTQGHALGDPVSGKWTILKTTNSGNSWVRMATEPLQNGTEAGWTKSFFILGTHIWFGTNTNRVYHSSNSGLTWTSGTTPGVTSTFAVHYNSVATGLAGGEGLARSNDSGASYSQLNTPAGNVYGLGGSGTEWWLVDYTEKIYMSTNAGSNWITAYTQTGTSLLSMDFAIVNNKPTGWYVGLAGTIIRMTSDTLSLSTHDVGPSSILGPLPVIEYTSTHYPGVNITNYGSATETFNVTIKITPGTYTNTETVTALAIRSHESSLFWTIFGISSG